VPAPGESDESASPAQVDDGQQDRSPHAKSAAASSIDLDLVKLAPGNIIAAVPVAKDSMVLSYIPLWSHGNVDNIGIGNYDGGFRTLIDWDPIAAQLAASPGHRFLIALYARKAVTTTPPGPILAFNITKSWPELTSWKTQPPYDPEPAASYKFEAAEGWKL